MKFGGHPSALPHIRFTVETTPHRFGIIFYEYNVFVRRYKSEEAWRSPRSTI
jgi:hypothetical protein